MRKIINYLIFSLLSFHCVFSQEGFLYKRQLIVNQGFSSWNYVTIPDELYEKVNYGLSDIRIYKFGQGDTSEVPYLIFRNLPNEQVTEKPCRIINESKNEQGQYFTIENIDNQTDINEINLRFSNHNFDWKLNLEGSHDQSRWFTILEDYRVMAIKNVEADYRFEKLIFSNTKYKYYRILVKTEEKVGLESAFFRNFVKKSENKFNKYNVDNYQVTNKPIEKKTIISFSLPHKKYVYSFEIEVDRSKNFYRPITFYSVDTLKMSDVPKPVYLHLTSDILTSRENKEFIAKSGLAKQFKIIIENQDNKPLDIKKITLKTQTQGIVFESEGEGDYFLYYGNKNSYKPKYDLEQFTTQIAEKQKDTISLSAEMSIIAPSVTTTQPLLNNKMWIWVVMCLIIILLGYFSFKMISQKKPSE